MCILIMVCSSFNQQNESHKVPFQAYGDTALLTPPRGRHHAAYLQILWPVQSVIPSPKVEIK